MTKSVVSFRLPENYVYLMDEIVKGEQYKSRKELIMEAVKFFVTKSQGYVVTKP
ncbi:MAG: ribbon-helix-helix domain-containing protein [Thermoprotei archaeon]